MIELLAASFLLAADIAAPSIDCGKVRSFVQTYGEPEAMRLARKWGYSDATIRDAQKCLSRARSS